MCISLSLSFSLFGRLSQGLEAAPHCSASTCEGQGGGGRGTERESCHLLMSCHKSHKSHNNECTDVHSIA